MLVWYQGSNILFIMVIKICSEFEQIVREIPGYIGTRRNPLGGMLKIVSRFN